MLLTQNWRLVALQYVYWIWIVKLWYIHIYISETTIQSIVVSVYIERVCVWEGGRGWFINHLFGDEVWECYIIKCNDNDCYICEIIHFSWIMICLNLLRSLIDSEDSNWTHHSSTRSQLWDAANSDVECRETIDCLRLTTVDMIKHFRQLPVSTVNGSSKLISLLHHHRDQKVRLHNGSTNHEKWQQPRQSTTNCMAFVMAIGWHDVICWFRDYRWCEHVIFSIVKRSQ